MIRRLFARFRRSPVIHHSAYQDQLNRFDEQMMDAIRRKCSATAARIALERAEYMLRHEG